jgi:hypothetical protein
MNCTVKGSNLKIVKQTARSGTGRRQTILSYPADYTHAFCKFTDFPGGEVVRVPARRWRFFEPPRLSVRIIGEI